MVAIIIVCDTIGVAGVCAAAYLVGIRNMILKCDCGNWLLDRILSSLKVVFRYFRIEMKLSDSYTHAYRKSRGYRESTMVSPYISSRAPTGSDDPAIIRRLVPGFGWRMGTLQVSQPTDFHPTIRGWTADGMRREKIPFIVKITRFLSALWPPQGTLLSLIPVYY
jgi:hypothetical protein